LRARPVEHACTRRPADLWARAVGIDGAGRRHRVGTESVDAHERAVLVLLARRKEARAVLAHACPGAVRVLPADHRLLAMTGRQDAGLRPRAALVSEAAILARALLADALTQTVVVVFALPGLGADPRLDVALQGAGAVVVGDAPVLAFEVQADATGITVLGYDAQHRLGAAARGLVTRA